MDKKIKQIFRLCNKKSGIYQELNELLTQIPSDIRIHFINDTFDTNEHVKLFFKYISMNFSLIFIHSGETSKKLTTNHQMKQIIKLNNNI